MVAPATPPSPPRGSQPSLWPALLAAALFFIALWKLDFPEPMCDDLFHSGAALNLAAGGDFSNPLLVRQLFPSHFFFMYPPLHPHALAGWLAVTGASSASLTGFQCLMYFIIAASTMVLLQRQGAPALLLWLAPLGVTAIMLPIGFRPEPLAVALTMAGFVLNESCRKSPAVILLSFLLLFLGAVAAPRTMIFALALAGLAFWRLIADPSADARTRWRLIGIAALALVITLVICGSLIGFRVGEFLATFRFHATRVTDHKLKQFLDFCRMNIGFNGSPLAGLAPLILVLLLRQPAHAATRLGYVLAGAFLLTALTGALGHGTAWFLVLILFAGLGAVSRQLPQRVRTALLAYFTVVLLIANGPFILRTAGMLSGRIDRQQIGDSRRARTLVPSAEHAVLADEFAARYVFDYRLPPGTLDFWFASPFPGVSVTDTTLRDSDIYVVGPAGAQQLNQRTFLRRPVPVWWPLGVVEWSQFQAPCQAFVISGKDCNGLRPKLIGR